MGDFSIIDPWQTFDIYNKDENGDKEYIHSLKILGFTWVVWCMTVFFTLTIFMNFIIAVIGGSFGKVQIYSVAHDYKQRV